MLNLYLLLSYVSAVTCSNTLSMLLCLVAAYVIAGLWLIQHSLYYVGLLYILVYVGAIVVLFVYVIQLLDTLVHNNTHPFGVNSQFRFSLIIGRLLTLTVLLAIISYGLSSINLSGTVTFGSNIASLESSYVTLTELSPPAGVQPLINSLQTLGQALFSEYSFALILSAHAIILAVIGPIKLALTTIPTKD